MTTRTPIAQELIQHKTDHGDTGCVCGWENPTRGDHNAWLNHVAEAIWESRHVRDEQTEAFAAGRRSAAKRAREMVIEARVQVKASVEEWFTDVSLDDLFAVKGWPTSAAHDESEA